MEAFSLLTRLPPPHRAPAALVAEFLAERFPDAPLVLPAREHLRIIAQAAAVGLSGSAIHDGLIAATVRLAGGRLVTRDRRAALTYQRLGTAYELLD